MKMYSFNGSLYYDAIRHYWDVHIFFYIWWPLSSFIWFSYCIFFFAIWRFALNSVIAIIVSPSVLPFMKCCFKWNLFKQILIENILCINHSTNCEELNDKQNKVSAFKEPSSKKEIEVLKSDYNSVLMVTNRILFYGQCVSLFPGFAPVVWPEVGLTGSASVD